MLYSAFTLIIVLPTTLHRSSFTASTTGVSNYVRSPSFHLSVSGKCQCISFHPTTIKCWMALPCYGCVVISWM
ncbi:hypothetical protein Hanom_Chr09g00785151 [Helianthus anomalus]